MEIFLKIISKLWEIVKKVVTSFHAQRYAAAIAFFVLFTYLLSSSLFANRLDIKPGEASPLFIAAPYAKVIEDKVKWEMDKTAAAAAVPDVISPDDGTLKEISKDLGDSFTNLRAIQADQQSDENVKIAKLKGTVPFTAMQDEDLKKLIKTQVNVITSTELDSSRVIIDIAKDTKSGVLRAEDLPALRDRLRTALAQMNLTPEVHHMLNKFVDLKIFAPTLRVDKEMTDAKRNEVKADVPMPRYSYTTNEKIVGLGEKVDDQIFLVLQEFGLIQNLSPWKGAAGIGVFVLISILSILLYLYNYRREIYNKTSYLMLLGLIVGLVLGLGKGIIALNIGPNYNTLLGFLIPLAWSSMVIAILVDAKLAIMTSAITCMFMGIMVDPQMHSPFGLQVALVTGAGAITGVFSVSHLSQRSDVARAAIFVGIANAIGVLAVGLISGMTARSLAVGGVLGIINGLVASVFTVGTLHWFESGFKITSAVRLLEISNPNRPLLRRLLMEAPATYHHSILVGNLAEAAAELTGADPLLVRVGALYHDIGKLKRPYFFIENQFANNNPHDKIAPTLSTLIITSHIKDGMELAREHNLPKPVLDIIEQHHANGLVSYFYHKALEGEKPETINESDFRYDANKPLTKEAALVFLADSVEAAVRSIKDSSPGQIPGLVRRIIKEKFNDGQLEECDLTFKDLSVIASAFDRVLSGIFHGRIEYPEMKDLEGRKTRGSN